MKTLFDTNIIIDALNGQAKAKQEIAACTYPAISIVTYLEVMAGTFPDTEQSARDLLLRFKTLDVDLDIADYAVALRQERGLSLTDAIIVATAQATGRTLITRDGKLDNDYSDPPVIIPYQL